MDEFDALRAARPSVDVASIAASRERSRSTYRERPGKARWRVALRARRGWKVAVVLAAMAVVSVIVAVRAGSDASSTATARTLETLAQRASEQPALAPGAYVYRHRRSDYSNSSSERVNGKDVSLSFRQLQDEEEWVARDGDFIRCGVGHAPEFVGAADRERWIATGRPELSGIKEGVAYYERFAGSIAKLGGVPADRLPTSESGIAKLMQSAQAQGDYWAAVAFGQTQELLASDLVSPAARAALFRYLASVPGISVLPRMRDHEGRVGIALAAGGTGVGDPHRPTMQQVLIIDPDTSNLLGYEETRLRRTDYADADPSTNAGWAVYLERGSTPIPDTIRQDTVPRSKVRLLSGPEAANACAALPRP